ncbi:MAG: translocation/assembly module TamB domain-containing protein [Sulfuricellaceae bacterium]|nr:translocation/assembly module TamB domain-containing protein [Sulfuricellaceae bacterium]
MRRAGYLLLVLAALLAGLYWTVGREASLRWTLAELAVATQGKLSFEGVQGGVLETISISHAAYLSPALDVHIENLQLHLSFWSLLQGQIAVDTLKARRVLVRSRPDDEPLKPPPDLVLPMSMDVRSVEVDQLDIQIGEVIRPFTRLHARLHSDDRQHKLELEHIESPWGTASMAMTLGTQSPFALSASGQYQPPPRSSYPQATLALSGDLLHLRAASQLRATGLELQAKADFLPFEAGFLESIELNLIKLNLHDFDQSMPVSELQGRLTLAAGGSGMIDLENRLAGRLSDHRLPVRKLTARLQAVPVGFNLDDAKLTLLQGDELAGHASLTGGRYQARFQTARLDLNALHASLKATRLAGTIEVDSEDSSQRFKLNLADRRFSYVLDATRRASKLSVHKALVQAGRSSLEAKGELDLSGRLAFESQLRLSKFDPSAWGDFPSASVNASGTAKGVLQPGWQVQANVSVSDSRLADQSLSGHLEGEFSQDRFYDTRGEWTLGRNHVSFNGGLGRVEDKLVLDFKLPDLSQLNALLGSKIGGELTGQARLQGSPKNASLEVELEGEQIRAPASLSAQKLKLMLKGAPSLEAPLAVMLKLDGVTAGAQHLGHVDVQLDGSGLAHRGSLSVAGKDVVLDARFAGGLKDREHWSGKLEHLAGSKPWPLQMAQPVDIALSRQRVDIGKAAFTAGGARFNLATFQFGPGILRTQGDFSGLPLLLGNRDKSAPVSGELRLAGDWNVEAAQHLNGTLHVRRESGHLLDNENGLKVRLVETRIDVLAHDDQIHAEGRVATERGSYLNARLDSLAVRRDGLWQIPGSSPLSLQADGNILYLDWVGPLIHPALSTGGKLSFTASAKGSVDHPDLQGELVGASLSVSEPGYGIRLSDGTLKARFSGSELLLDELIMHGKEGELSASGTALFPGAKGLPKLHVDFRASQLGLLDRPGWQINADSEGSFHFEQGKAILQGSIVVNKAQIGLPERGVPTLSEDIVVKGRTLKGEEKQGSRIALDISVDLGKDFRIRTLGEGQKLRKLIPLYNNGIDARLAGHLEIRTDASGKPLAEGGIRVRDGVYTFMGRPLEIKRGTLRFGGALDNPSLDILARNEQTEVKVGVSVTGTAKNPRALLVSDPEVPEQEKLSWLLFGRSGESVDPSLSKVAGGGTFGMQLSDKFYIGYDQGAGATSSAMTLYGRLTDRLTVEARSGNVSAIRLFYLFNLRRDKGETDKSP